VIDKQIILHIRQDMSDYVSPGLESSSTKLADFSQALLERPLLKEAALLRKASDKLKDAIKLIDMAQDELSKRLCESVK